MHTIKGNWGKCLKDLSKGKKKKKRNGDITEKSSSLNRLISG